MDSLKINKDVCRICLNQNIKLNWNNEMIGCNGVSYKDCYYKYTQLKESDSGCYPTNLCQMCAIGLESAHMLFEKALESFNFLHAVLETKQHEAKYELQTLNDLGTTLLQIEDDVCHSPVYSREKVTELQNDLSDFEKEVTVEDEVCSLPAYDRETIPETHNNLNDFEKEEVSIEPMHFIDIQRIEAYDEISLDLSEMSNSDQPNDHCDTKLSKTLTSEESIENNTICASIKNSLLEKQLSNDKLPKQSPIKSAVKKVKRKASLQKNILGSCADKSVIPASKTTKAKLRIFKCAYCSLKVKGSSNLARHEATHYENGKRAQTCPHFEKEEVSIEPMHFIDIQRVETYDEISLGLSEMSTSDQSNDYCDTKLSNTLTSEESMENNTICASIKNSRLEKQLSNEKLPKQSPIKSAVKKVKREASLQRNLLGSCADKSVIPASKTTKSKISLDLNEMSNSDQSNDHCDTKLSNTLTSEESNENNTICASIKNSRLEKQLSKEKLPKQSPIKSAVKKVKRKASLQQNLLGSCADKSVIPGSKTTKAIHRIFMCAYCSLKIKGGSNLARHEATHNENRKRTQTCPHCGIKLYTKMHLQEHIKIHEEKRVKKYKCEFCEKAFYYKGPLNIHRRIHLGLMVKCQLCSKEYFRQVDLDRHLLKHSAAPIQRNVAVVKYEAECQYCNKYILTSRWTEHLATHLDQPQVKCKICDKNFSHRRNCTRHLRVLHLKESSEYENYIHYYSDRASRTSRNSLLMMKQQMNVRPRTVEQHTDVP